MGLFSSRTKTFVSSVAYNLGGDLKDRPDFMKNIVLGGIFTNSKDLTRDVVGSHLNGPGIKQRSFYNWSKTEYPEGACEVVVSQGLSVEHDLVRPYLTTPPGGSVVISTAFIDNGDITYWAQRWLLLNKPEAYTQAWLVDYDPIIKKATISYPTGSDDEFYPGNFSSERRYVVAYYTQIFAPGSGMAPKPLVYIYRIGGSNTVLNALSRDLTKSQDIFPIIPLRLNNVPISHSSFEDDYDQHAKAFKKATGKPMIEMLAAIDDNPNVGDIDYCFLVHGVELNTVEPEGQRYLYEFFRDRIPQQKTSEADFTNWVASVSEYKSQSEIKKAWLLAQKDPLNTLFGTVEPILGARVELEYSRFETHCPKLNYYTHLGWVTIVEEVGTGLGKPDAERGDFWTESLTDLTIPGVMFAIEDGVDQWAKGALARFRLFWQDEEDSYRFLTVYGMVHENFVYAGKVVQTSASEALEEVEESGFVVPLHYPTLKKLPLTTATQLAISNRILVFNCYKQKKQRWYQRGIFRIILMVAIVVVSAVFFPAAGGLLGANAALGATLGFTGTAGLIVGGIVNAVAAMLLMTVIESAAVSLFGEKLGFILGAIASFMTMQYVAGFMTNGSWIFNLGDMIKVENLLKLTNAVSQGVQKWAAWEVGQLQEEALEDYNDYNDTRRQIEKKYLEEFGYGQAAINPLLFLQEIGSSTLDTFGQMDTESSKQFLARTMMTGSDIVEMSLSFTRNFAELALTLPDTSM